MGQIEQINQINFLTIDVEDYFHVHAFSKVVKPEQWDGHECRVEANTYRILDLLDSYGFHQNPELKIQNSKLNISRSLPASQPSGWISSSIQHPKLEIKNSEFKIKSFPRATFFILGWVAERYPKLIREIHDRGHEVASHGYGHRVIYQQSKEEFRQDIRRSKGILEDLIGEKIRGYRAPTYSITQKTLWALAILAEEGYEYDSSVFPVRHDYYGMPHCPRFPFLWDVSRSNSPRIMQNSTLNTHDSEFNIQNSTFNIIREFPLSTLNLFGQRLPIAGGGYFRLYPYWFTKWALRRINTAEKHPFIFYIHPWEIDPDQPRVNHLGMLSRFRHYNNLDKTIDRFKRLLTDFHFAPIWSVN